MDVHPQLLSKNTLESNKIDFISDGKMSNSKLSAFVCFILLSSPQNTQKPPKKGYLFLVTIHPYFKVELKHHHSCHLNLFNTILSQSTILKVYSHPLYLKHRFLERRSDNLFPVFVVFFPLITVPSTKTDHDRTGAQKYAQNLSKKVKLEVEYSYYYHLLLITK